MHTSGNTPFGDRLKKERQRRGFGVVMFSDKCGFHVSQLTAYENRGVKPRYNHLIAMAQVLECSLDWLCGLEEGGENYVE